MGRRKSLEETILDNSSPEPMSGCWLWLGTIDTDGYARMRNRRVRDRLAHRISYETFIGPIPGNLPLDHLCRTRCCVNPQHLEPVPPKINSNRGRNANREMTACHNGHPFDEKNTWIRKNGKRVCRACRQERARAYYYKDWMAKKAARRAIARKRG